MYNFNLLSKLPYNYDEEFIEFDKEYKINFVYYRFNDRLTEPFLELILNNQGQHFYSVNNDTFITPKNLDGHIISGEFKLNDMSLQCRYQGYHCCESNIYLYYRIIVDNKAIDQSAIFSEYYNNDIIIATLYDIIQARKIFYIDICKDIVNYFNTFKDEFNLYNIFNNNIIFTRPETIYTSIDNIEQNVDYIIKNGTIYFLHQKGPVLILDNNAPISENSILVKNVVFDKNRIISHRQIMSIVENKK
jgi:hypothetical protein